MAQLKKPGDREPASTPLAALEGVVERLTFADPETHYAVVRLKVKGRRDPVTVVGPLAGTREGEQLELKGHYEVHPKWGEQFKVTWWYAVLPATVAGIKRYLASGLVKGIGQAPGGEIRGGHPEDHRRHP
jgi:exodeoxyribonuclease V alpha subunit